MHQEYKYKIEDYKELQDKYMKATLVCYGKPDEYQMHQNDLSKALAEFLLKPYVEYLQNKEN